MLISVLAGTLQRSVEVSFSTTEGTATSSDFNSQQDVILQFDETSLTQMVNVAIISDNILEGTESFFGNLTTSDSDVTLNPSAAVVNILDVGDGKTSTDLEPYTQSLKSKRSATQYN